MVGFARLPESELDVMLTVWKHGGEASAPAIGESLGRELTASALHSYLKRLEEKGFLACRKAGKRQKSCGWRTVSAAENFRSVRRRKP